MNGREAREVYRKGRKFRVVREQCRLSGMTPIGPGAHQGWGQQLHLGDVIECEGFSMGWGSDSIPVVKWKTDETVTARAQFVQFVPSKGLWEPYPDDDFVEPVEEE